MSPTRVGRANRPNVLFRRAVRRTWGDNPDEVVVLAVLRFEPDRQLARVLAVRDGRATVLEEHENVELVRSRPTSVRLADGTTWVPGRVGCTCHVPAQLRGIDPTRVPA